MDDKQITTDNLSYTEAVRELDQIVRKMESDQCDIDSLAGYTSRALELLKHCKQRLFKVDEEVNKCLETLKDTIEGEGE